MSKKNKKQGHSGRNSGTVGYSSVELPIVVDMDAIAYAMDDELRDRFNYLHSTMDYALRNGVDPKPWEVELAYVQREFQIRDSRKATHERYTRQNPDDVVEVFDATEDFSEDVN